MSPKMLENRAREAPKTLLEPRCRWMLFWDLFWAHFWTPRTPKNRALAVARCYFCKNGMTRPGAQNGAQNDPQIEPQTTPRGFQIAKKILPNRRLMFGQMSAPFWTIWGIQNDPKKHPKTAFGAQWSLGGLQGTLWGAFGIHFGIILKLPGPGP